MTIESTSDVQAREDFWQVQLASGEICVWTIEELDEAFQSNQVHERTLVKKLGDETWSTLAVVAGLEEAPEVAPVPAPVPTSPETLPSMASVPPAGPSSLAPVATSLGSIPAPASVAPPSAATAEVRRELEIEIEPSFKSRHRGLVVAGVLAAIVLGLGGVAVKVAGSASAAGPSVQPNTLTTDVHHLPQTPTGDDPFIAKPLTDDQKRALIEADKKRAEELDKKRKAAEAERAAHAPAGPRRPAGKGADIKGSDNRYDPLNGSL